MRLSDPRQSGILSHYYRFTVANLERQIFVSVTSEIGTPYTMLFSGDVYIEESTQGHQKSGGDCLPNKVISVAPAVATTSARSYLREKAVSKGYIGRTCPVGGKIHSG